MRKRLIVAAIVFGIASLAGISIGINSPFAVDNALVDENDRAVLRGNVHPKARPEFDQGPTDPSLPMERMILQLKLAPEKKTELDRLLTEQQDRSSPNFHRWLTPEQFGKKFGRSPEEIATVKNWLVSHGFSVEETAKSGAWINFSGTAADVERAFHANMHDYSVEGKLHHANSTDPSIPRALADLVAGPVTLHNFRHKPAHTRSGPTPERKLQPQYNESDGSHDLAPGDFAVIYDVNGVYNQGYDGTGVTIAIVGRTYQNTPQNDAATKWSTFRKLFGLPTNNPPKVILNGPNPGDLGAADDAEADLDVEWSGAVAKGATIDFVASKSTNSADGSDLSAQYIVDRNLAPIMSDSFSSCEPDMGPTWQTFYTSLWKQAASQGITVIVASGDTGAFDCTDSNGLPLGGKSVNGLASTPYNIAVGGTQFNLGSNPGIYWSAGNASDGASALSYIPEAAWNDWTTPACGPVQGCEAASGGGASKVYSKPSWQISPGVPSDDHRDVPDVSLNADDLNVPYKVYTCNNVTGSCGGNGWWTIGGTSCGTPSFAGIMALLVQSAGHERQGNFNSALYQFGNAQYGGTSGAYKVFNDITSGNNSFTKAFTGNSCGVGYDLVTGLGSVNALHLLLAFKAGGSGGSLTVTISPAGAVNEGAMWNVDNGTWQVNGATISNLSAGPHTVYFQDTTDWKAPASLPVTISYDQAQTATGTYVIKPPVLGPLLIDNGAASTPVQSVTLNNTATRVSSTYSANSYYMASQSPTFAGASLLPYSAAPSFTLSAGWGTKTVYIKVKNDGGVSNVLSSHILFAQPPGAPTLLTAKRGNGIATVTFRPPTLNGGSPIILYTVTSSDGETGTGTVSPIIVKGLTNGNSYTFTVTATNKAGTSLQSNLSSVVIPATVPDAPAITSVTGGPANATVYFTPPVFDGGSPITGYTVTSHPGAVRAKVSGTPASIVVPGLKNGVAYTFTISATNAAGTGVPSVASQQVTPATKPGKPTGVHATLGMNTGTVNVSFISPANGGSPITVYYIISAADGSIVAQGTKSPITVTALTSGTPYTFKVMAANAVGDGPYSSNSNSVTPR